MPETVTDTLPQWLHHRFRCEDRDWDQLSEGDQLYWQHEAAAVRRAVARNGFKTELDATRARLQAFRAEAMKNPKIAKNICAICGLDRLNDVHRDENFKGHHPFEPSLPEQ
jgi:hypothetical protein